MKFLIAAIIALAGIIHLLPVIGFAGVTQLKSLYGVDIADPNIEILMRHRAILFGLLGTFLLYSILKPAVQTIAIIGALVSTVTFLYLTWATGTYNASIAKVFYIDIALALGLVLALALRLAPAHAKI